jgi:uncharacterized protein (UPF0276 family)
MSVQPFAPFHAHGIDLRPEHYTAVLEEPPPVDWVELVSERFLHARGGIAYEVLEKVRRDLPVTLHGTTLSIGSVDPLRADYLHALRVLADRVEPVWVSDHLAWSSYGGAALDLLPLPYTEDTLAHVADRVGRVQDALGRLLLLENPSSHFGFAHSTLREWEFLAALCARTGCGVLLDVNNLHVAARNLGFDPSDYLDGLPAGVVRQIHLSGHRDLGDVVIDTHQGPVPACVWDLYREALRRFGPVPTIVEWDTDVPALPTLVAESHRASAIAEETCRGPRRHPEPVLSAHLR